MATRRPPVMTELENVESSLNHRIDELARAVPERRLHEVEARLESLAATMRATLESQGRVSDRDPARISRPLANDSTQRVVSPPDRPRAPLEAILTAMQDALERLDRDTVVLGDRLGGILAESAPTSTGAGQPLTGGTSGVVNMIESQVTRLNALSQRVRDLTDRVEL